MVSGGERHGGNVLDSVRGRVGSDGVDSGMGEHHRLLDHDLGWSGDSWSGDLDGGRNDLGVGGV